MHPRWGGADLPQARIPPSTKDTEDPRCSCHMHYTISPRALAPRKQRSSRMPGLRGEFGDFSSPRAPAAPQTAELMPFLRPGAQLAQNWPPGGSFSLFCGLVLRSLCWQQPAGNFGNMLPVKLLPCSSFSSYLRLGAQMALH